MTSGRWYNTLQDEFVVHRWPVRRFKLKDNLLCEIVWVISSNEKRAASVVLTVL
jgi:hypothetical protein